MTLDLKSYVEKYILNQNSLTEEDDESQAKVENVDLKDSALEKDISASKLRSINAPSLADKNIKYSDKRVDRKNLRRVKNDQSYDPDILAKFMLPEHSSDDVSSDSDNDADSENGRESDSFDEESEGPDSDDNKVKSKDLSVETGNSMPQVQTFAGSTEKSLETSKAVKNQIDLYNSLFELRIGLHKAVTSSNILPRDEQFKAFAANKLHKETLKSTKTRVKSMITQLLSLQDTLLSRNIETKGIVDQEKNSNSELVDESPEKVVGTTRKRKLDELEKTIYKRHKAFQSYRDETLDKWYKKSQSINSNKKGSNNFSQFEKSPLEQYNTILSNRDYLIKRTQLVSVERDNQSKVIGSRHNIKESIGPTYDPEIFDDTDFYSQQVEAILHSKMGVNRGSNMMATLANVAALRKKAAKKKVDSRFNKDRKLKFKMIPKMQNYLGPCKYSSMNDDTLNKLFASLFGQTGMTR